MRWVIRRIDQNGGWVRADGRGETSYTRELQHARWFPSREAALKEVCPGNEVVESIEYAMDFPPPPRLGRLPRVTKTA